MKSSVLLVEDDPDSREVLERLLAIHDYDVDSAASAGEALVRLEQDELPSAVILDLRLPDASGGVVLRRIRRSDLPVRVAIVTGVHDPFAFADLTSFPADALFKKPVDQPALIRWLTGN